MIYERCPIAPTRYVAAKVATIETAPEGIWTMVVRPVEKPNEAMMMLEKLDTAPLSIMASRVMKNSGQVSLSRNRRPGTA